MGTLKFEHHKDFYFPIIAILKDLGGQASTKQIYEVFLSEYGNQLDQSFFTEIIDGDIKWKDYINRAGHQLVIKGYIKRAGFGIWKLTRKQYLQE